VYVPMEQSCSFFPYIMGFERILLFLKRVCLVQSSIVRLTDNVIYPFELYVCMV
jgi:hypothetical protein